MSEFDIQLPKYNDPPTASTLRRAARAALKGHWLRMALVMLVYTLLFNAVLNASFSTEYNEARVEETLLAADTEASYAEYLVAWTELPAIDVHVELSFGPLLASHTVPLDMSSQQRYELPLGERLVLPYRVGLTSLPQSVVPLTIAVAALSLLVLIFRPALELGKYEAMSALYRNERPRLKHLFSKLRFWRKALWLWILQTFYTVAWMLLFIVPGIIASYRYSMAFFILWKNPDMRAIDALRESKRRMGGHKGRLFGLHWSFFGWMLLSIVPIIPLYSVPLGSPELLFACRWAVPLVSGFFLTAYMQVADFEFFRDLEMNEYDEPV